ncbi:MAG: archease [Planctomycetaceae bacterium]
MPYEFLEDVATADIAFKAWGRDLEETFIAAADATLNVMVEDLGSIQPRESRDIRLENDDLDLLLHDFLQELVYYKDSEKLMLRARKVEIDVESHPFTLEGIARGETLDPERHHPRVDVKAVTLHQFQLKKTDRGWEARVILDI